MSIAQFFVRKDPNCTPSKCPEETSLFKPFIPKKDMTLAPIIRTIPLKREELQRLDNEIGSVEDNDTSPLYVEELRRGFRHPQSSKRASFPEPEISVIERRDHPCPISRHPKFPRKLLQFHDNRRPSKYGYWTRKSKFISGRRPFAKDQSMFNYEVDSDDEWEEEEGDDCKSDEEDNEGENENHSEDDDDKSFFVDHGYLSPSENASDEEDGDPETRRERGKAKMMTFEAEMESRKKKNHLRLIAIGPCWSNDGRNAHIWSQKMTEFSAITLSSTTPIPTSFTANIHTTPLRSSRGTPASERKSTKRKNQQENRGKRPKRGSLSLP